MSDLKDRFAHHGLPEDPMKAILVLADRIETLWHRLEQENAARLQAERNSLKGRAKTLWTKLRGQS